MSTPLLCVPSKSSQESANGGPTARRDVRGRFVPRASQSNRRLRRVEQQRAYVGQRATLKKKLYQDFLHAFCRQGSNRDHILSWRSRGPLVEIFERVLKKPYRMGRTERRSRMCTFYTDGGHLGRRKIRSDPHNTPILSPLTLPSRSTKFIGCRLPSSSRRVTEMEDVRSWLGTAFSTNALTASTVEEAYNACTEVINSYHAGSRKASQAPQHGPISDPSNLCANCLIVNLTPFPNGSTVTGVQNNVPPQQGACNLQRDQQVVSAHELEVGRTDSLIPNPVSVSDTEQQLAEEDIILKAKLECLTKAASNDTNYFMPSSLFDDNIENNFSLCASVCLNQCAREGGEPTKLMKEVLLYAQCKRFGIVDANKHASREEELQATLKLFDALRTVAGMKFYSGMRWGFQSPSVRAVRVTLQ